MVKDGNASGSEPGDGGEFLLIAESQPNSTNPTTVVAPANAFLSFKLPELQ